MTTQVNFHREAQPLVSLKDLKTGEGFMWSGKLYLKVREEKVLRIKGDNQFYDFEVTSLGHSTKVEPLNVEINFSVK